ncbi:Rad9/Ddc1, partial [Lipomyces oligophaga]|uniref:Rad9/Ddc1 n=1 Tax=Lipomyces oligophaga TaxID=45792 RepID=UPI0034CE9FB6
MAAQFAVTIASGNRLRDWARSLNALSRVSDTILLDVKNEEIDICCTNATRSVFAQIQISKEFFDKYIIKKSGKYNSSQSINNHGDRVCIEVQTRFLVTIFRKHEKDVNVEKCDVRLDNTHKESRLVVQFHCRYGITKTYRMGYESAKPYKVLHSADDYANTFEIKATILRDYVEHTSSRAEAFSMQFTPDQVVLTSFTEAAVKDQEILKQPLQTSIHLDSVEFDHVFADDEAGTAFSLKEFRALVALAQGLDADIRGSFGEPTMPIVFEFEIGAIKATFLLFTAA